MSSLGVDYHRKAKTEFYIYQYVSKHSHHNHNIKKVYVGTKVSHASFWSGNKILLVMMPSWTDPLMFRQWFWLQCNSIKRGKTNVTIDITSKFLRDKTRFLQGNHLHTNNHNY